MVKNVIKISLSAFVLFSSLSSLALANDDGILEFKSSIADPETGKTIMTKIKKAHPKFFIKKVEDKKNSEDVLAYVLTSNSIEKATSKYSDVTFSNTFVNKKRESVETRVFCVGKKYKMSVELLMSEDCLSEKGKKYFEALAKGQRGIIEELGNH